MNSVRKMNIYSQANEKIWWRIRGTLLIKHRDVKISLHQDRDVENFILKPIDCESADQATGRNLFFIACLRTRWYAVGSKAHNHEEPQPSPGARLWILAKRAGGGGGACAYNR
ncbi:MAG: hypothetical protein WAM73_19185 [Desulfobacterales bacterium]